MVVKNLVEDSESCKGGGHGFGDGSRHSSCREHFDRNFRLRLDDGVWIGGLEGERFLLLREDIECRGGSFGLRRTRGRHLVQCRDEVPIQSE